MIVPSENRRGSNKQLRTYLESGRKVNNQEFLTNDLNKCTFEYLNKKKKLRCFSNIVNVYPAFWAIKNKQDKGYNSAFG